MTKKLVGALALFSSLALAAVGADTKKAAPAPAPAAAPKQQKLIRVSTLNTVEANQQFQANVQLVQTQRQQAIELNARLEKEADPAKKKELKAQLDALMAKLNENHQLMVRTYGFSLERNYTIVPEVSHVYMFVSDEEAAKFEKEQKELAAKAEKEAAAKKKK
ncbi:MAG: hypothetical protein HZA93_04245 [Verrucomicrobia bacterium]|nr:hypothetical protein [Verrucomicrobiota bacterium]